MIVFAAKTKEASRHTVNAESEKSEKSDNTKKQSTRNRYWSAARQSNSPSHKKPFAPRKKVNTVDSHEAATETTETTETTALDVRIKLKVNRSQSTRIKKSDAAIITNYVNDSTVIAASSIEENNVWAAFHAVKEILKLRCDCGCEGNPLKCRSNLNTALKKTFFELRDYLVIKNLNFFKRTASIAIGNKRPITSVITRSDSMSSAILAGIKCIHEYDRSHSSMASFVTFSYMRVRGEIIDELRRVQDFSNTIPAMRRAVNPRIEMLSHVLGRNPTIEDLKESFTDREFEMCMNPLMFSIVRMAGDDLLNFECGTKRSSASSTTSDIRRRGSTRECVNVNPIDLSTIIGNEELEDIIYCYYYLGMPEKEIAIVYGMSISNVSKKKNQAEEIIRSYYGTRQVMVNKLYE